VVRTAPLAGGTDSAARGWYGQRRSRVVRTAPLAGGTDSADRGWYGHGSAVSLLFVVLRDKD